MLKKTIYTLSLLIITEFLYLDGNGMGWITERWQKDAHSYSIGFPCRSITYTTVNVSGKIHPWENYPEIDKWHPGIQAKPIFLLIDIINIFIIFFIVTFCIPFHILTLIFKACCTGTLLAIIGFIFMEVLGGSTSESWFYVFAAIFLYFIILPTTLYHISSTIPRQKISIFILAFISVLSIFLVTYRLEDIFVSPESTFEIIYLMYGSFYFALVCIECLLIIILRKVILKHFKPALKSAQSNVISIHDGKNNNETLEQ